MDAIKPGFWSGSEPINLIRDALNRGEIAHTDGVQVKYLPRAVGARYVTVCQPLPPAVLRLRLRADRQECAHARRLLGIGSHA